jgi:hypothetical protein
MGEIIDIGIDRATATHEELTKAYTEYWNAQNEKHKTNYEWLKGRIKQLGYKSLAQFVRENNIPVGASTVANYFRGYTIPLYMVKHFCYALKITPNTFLSIMGYYDPKKQTIMDL